MNFDDGDLEALIEESNDLQSGAVAQGRASCEKLDDVGRLRAAHPPDLDRLGNASIGRRRLLKAGCFGLAILASGGLLRKPLGSTVAAIVRRPQSVPSDAVVQILQTAASLENLVVATYAAALELPFVHENAVILQFAETTMQQHSEHGALFNAQAEDLGGERQDAPNPRYSEVVHAAMPTLTNAAAVVELAATLEEVATDTYLANLTLLRDATMRTLMASVMGVESQHLATLRAVGALIAAGVPELVAIPTDLSALPASAGSVAFPLPFEVPNFASSPAEGAVR
jgi:hypothetical protein